MSDEAAGPESDAAGAPTRPSELPGPVVFYDGACPLCHWAVAFLLARDEAGRLKFAHLQGRTAAETLPPELIDTTTEGTVVLFDPSLDPPLRTRSQAILGALSHVGPGWRIAARIASLPGMHPVAEAAYRFVASRRARWFGQTDECELPGPELRPRFLA